MYEDRMSDAEMIHPLPCHIMHVYSTAYAMNTTNYILEGNDFCVVTVSLKSVINASSCDKGTVCIGIENYISLFTITVARKHRPNNSTEKN